MKYKAIGFDWGGVLNGRPSKFFTQAACELLGVTHQDYIDAYLKHNEKVNRGDIDWQQLWELVTADLNKLDKAQEITELSQLYNIDNMNPQVLSLVDKLRGMGYKTGLLSNNTIARGESLRHQSLDQHFDVFHISAETRLVKPEPEAFRLFADELSVELSELVFIDDSEKSLSTSAECGFTPILFESYEQLTRELTNLGVLPQIE